jgi:hypothetical protein
MNFLAIFHNHVLIGALLAWSLAQGFKIPIYYLRTRRWNWALLFSVGGMPSSHSALVVAMAHGLGLYSGFDSPLFALGVTFAVVVIYDAAGLRRQAGIHAQKINILVNELLSGHQVSDKDLREVLGHTPFEVLAGILLGLAVSQLLWFVWR